MKKNYPAIYEYLFMIKTIIITISLLFITAPTSAEETAQVITWDSLLPSTQPLEDPFKDLTDEQLYDLESIVYFREMDGQRGAISSDDTKEVIKLTASLKSANLDVDELLSTYTEYLAEIERLNGLVVNELNGRFVRLAGYVLPLEFSDKGVDEFLLVPYVGACIHVPPPPANQIVYVRTNHTIMADDLYRPVWVTGHMGIEASTRDLTLVDGSDNIPIGYTLKRAVAENYEE
jgi:uncharacterized protein